MACTFQNFILHDKKHIKKFNFLIYNKGHSLKNTQKKSNIKIMLIECDIGNNKILF